MLHFINVIFDIFVFLETEMLSRKLQWASKLITLINETTIKWVCFLFDYMMMKKFYIISYNNRTG